MDISSQVSLGSRVSMIIAACRHRASCHLRRMRVAAGPARLSRNLGLWRARDHFRRLCRSLVNLGYIRVLLLGPPTSSDTLLFTRLCT